MDLTQRKLTKEEWESLEIPLPSNELRILKMIYNSYENVNYVANDSISINVFMKITDNYELYNYHFYEVYFKSLVSKITKKYNLRFVVNNNKPKKKYFLSLISFLVIRKTIKTIGPITDEKFFSSFGIINHKGKIP